MSSKVRICVYDDNIVVENCHLMGWRYIYKSLRKVREQNPDCKVFQHRLLYSLACEWALHSVLYKVGLFRKRTKDADLQYPNPWGWLYMILGTIIYVFA